MRPSRRPITTRAFVPLAAALALAACGSRAAQLTSTGDAGTPPDSGAPSAPPQPCSPDVAPMAHALIGPDVTIRALCASPARAPIASVSEEGLGVVDWSVTLRGDPTFGADGPFGTCAKTRTQVATVTFDPPPDATPGRTFDTVATVSSQNGAFADGTVNVHGLIVAASASTSTTTLDFGDVAPGAAVSLPLRFALSSDQVVLTVRIDNLPVLFVIQKNGGLIQSTVSAWTVTFTAPAAPGSYTDMLTFDAVPGAAPDAGPECTWTQVISLRARVVAAGADGGTRG